MSITKNLVDKNSMQLERKINDTSIMLTERKKSPYAISPELLATLDKQWNDFDLGAETQSHPNKNQPKKKNKIGFFRWTRRIVVSLGVLVTGLFTTYVFFPRLAVTFLNHQFGAYPSIFLAAGSVLGILMIMYFSITFILSRKVVWNSWIQNGLIALVLSYMAYGLLFLNNANTKDSAIQETYLNLHPVLRIGLTTAILADTKLIVTNTQRTKEDYIKWGLTPREQSLHYIQAETGFVHAVDLRTKGRPEIQNRLVELGFKLMGFKTLRHVGTADHLHVSLPYYEH
ncbi:hypothetical protein EP331_04975 [bacterium]|nr:MAG: hypothetical protein EP331_04975 [bacterium]